MKPYYKLQDLTIINPKTEAKAWTAECPMCGKSHLKINRTSGLFHCWTPNCNFKGIVDEYKDQMFQHNALGERCCDGNGDGDGNVNGNGNLNDNLNDNGNDNLNVNGNDNGDVGRHSAKKSTNRQPSSAVPSTPMTSDADVIPEDYTQLADSVVGRLRSIDAMPDVVRYLEKQHIPVEVAQGCGCYAAVKTCHGKDNKPQSGPCLAYVSYVFGNIVNIKYRLATEKLFTQDVSDDKTLPLPPYNIDCINPITDDTPGKVLILTEGEKDVLTLRACGYKYVISPPNGSGTKPETCMAPFVEWLDTVEHIVICGDSDRAGRVMKRQFREYFEQLGKTVTTATLPYGMKDISDVNHEFGIDTVRSIITPLCTVPNPECIRIADDRRGIRDVLMGRFDHGYTIGYGPLTDQHFMLTDEGGLIVVTGRPGHGKTSWMRCSLTRLMMQKDKRVCFLSFEEPNKRKQVRRIVELAFDTVHTEDIPAKDQDAMLDRLDSRMVNLSLTTTTPTASNIISQCDRLLRQGFMMDFLYIDPYLYIQSENTHDSETLQIKQILTRLQGWARERHIWVIVVAHPRKLVKDGLAEYEEVDEYTISGSAHWANLADYLLSVKRVFPGGISDEGSQAPSFTVVNMLKVRDQSICHTGRMYFLRHSSGRYEERKDENECKQELNGAV